MTTEPMRPLQLYCYDCRRVRWHDVSEAAARRDFLGLPLGPRTVSRLAVCQGCGGQRDVPDQLLPNPRRP